MGFQALAAAAVQAPERPNRLKVPGTLSLRARRRGHQQRAAVRSLWVNTLGLAGGQEVI